MDVQMGAHLQAPRALMVQGGARVRKLGLGYEPRPALPMPLHSKVSENLNADSSSRVAVWAH